VSGDEVHRRVVRRFAPQPLDELARLLLLARAEVDVDEEDARPTAVGSSSIAA